MSAGERVSGNEASKGSREDSTCRVIALSPTPDETRASKRMSVNESSRGKCNALRAFCIVTISPVRDVLRLVSEPGLIPASSRDDELFRRGTVQ